MEAPYKMKNSIVLVPFPFDDFSDSKIRPALCLTNEIGNYQHVIIAFISSNLESNLLESDFFIKILFYIFRYFLLRYKILLQHLYCMFVLN